MFLHNSKDDKVEEFKFSEKLELHDLQRLVLIDGFNIMHHFKDMRLEDTTFDDKMCPLVLVPLICSLLNEGFIVRVVLKNMPPDKRISDSYVLEALQNAEICLYCLHEDVEEEDDLLMLKLARKYGAIIISRDQFRNHKGYEDVTQKYVVGYDKIPTGHLKDRFSAEELKRHLCYKYTISLHDNPESFIVDPMSEDYELVQKSHDKFKQVTLGGIETLKLLDMYIYASFCYIYNYGIPQVVEDFIKEDRFPISFDKFCFDFDARRKHKKKHHIRDKKPVEEYVPSDDDLEYEKLFNSFNFNSK